MPLVDFLAAAMFFGCYLLIREYPDSKPAAIGQLTIWARIRFSNSCPQLMINKRTIGSGYTLAGYCCSVYP